MIKKSTIFLILTFVFLGLPRVVNGLSFLNDWVALVGALACLGVAVWMNFREIKHKKIENKENKT